MLSDNGPEFTGKAFKTRIGELGLVHHRIPPRSPNHNAVCERFHSTVLREFYRPHFHRGRVEDIALLNRSQQTWIADYNHHRPNHGDYMAGRTPAQVKKQLRRRIRHTAAWQPVEQPQRRRRVTPTRAPEALGDRREALHAAAHSLDLGVAHYRSASRRSP